METGNPNGSGAGAGSEPGQGKGGSIDTDLDCVRLIEGIAESVDQMSLRARGVASTGADKSYLALSQNAMNFVMYIGAKESRNANRLLLIIFFLLLLLALWLVERAYAFQNPPVCVCGGDVAP